MHKLTLHAKDIMGSVAVNGKIVAIVAGSAIMSQKFLDLKEIVGKFSPVETGSTMEKILDHQGAIKVVGGMAALHLLRNKSIGKNDLFKWAMIGLMLQGAIQEVNQLTGDGAGQIGESAIDKEMKEAAEHIKKNMSGNPTTEFVPSVQGQETIGEGNPTMQYTPSVQGSALENGTSVGHEDDYSFLHGSGHFSEEEW